MYRANISHFRLVPDVFKKRAMTLRKKFKLTIRQLDVMFGAAIGMDIPDIAETLCVSRTTVPTHLNNIYQKLNINSKAELMVIAYAHNFPSSGALRFMLEIA